MEIQIACGHADRKLESILTETNGKYMEVKIFQ